jgi:hypothetical protein
MVKIGSYGDKPVKKPKTKKQKKTPKKWSKKK